jgi:hypothetical protein
LGWHAERPNQLVQAARAFTNVGQLLANLRADQVVADGDGIPAAELSK